MMTTCGKNGCGSRETHPLDRYESNNIIIQCEDCAEQDAQFEDFMARLDGGEYDRTEIKVAS